MCMHMCVCLHALVQRGLDRLRSVLVRHLDGQHGERRLGQVVLDEVVRGQLLRKLRLADHRGGAAPRSRRVDLVEAASAQDQRRPADVEDGLQALAVPVERHLGRRGSRQAAVQTGQPLGRGGAR